MPMRIGKDDRGCKIDDTDHLHYFYRLPSDGVGEPVPLGVWASDRDIVVGGEMWEVQEEMLVAAFEDGTWDPGTYRVVTHANYSGGHISTIERPMPMPPGYTRLGKSPRDGLPARAFALNVMRHYPGSTLDVVGEHILTFGEHWQGGIDTATLAERTGYVLPEGAPRPHHPNVVVTDANR